VAQFVSSLRILVLAACVACSSACHCAPSGRTLPTASPGPAPSKPFTPLVHCPVAVTSVAVASTGFVAGADDDANDEEQERSALVAAYTKSYAAKRYEEALACGQELSRLAPDELTGHLARAVAFDALGQVNEASSAYERAIAIDPDEPTALLPAAKFLVRNGDNDSLETAVLYARRGREHEETAAVGAELAAVEAEALNGIGRSDEALHAAESALALNADRPQAVVERGVALYELLRFDEADRTLAEARARDPGSARAFYYAGLLAERLDRSADARRFIAEATRLDPEMYPADLDVSLADFQKIVDEEIAGLTAEQRSALRGTAFSWQDLPSLEDLHAGDPVLSPTIVGIFRPGQPDARDSILLYRKNLLHVVRSVESLHTEVRDTILHELGHLSGEDDEELRDRGL
jgi:tetratricopeptide (TPR) repeat protein